MGRQPSLIQGGGGFDALMRCDSAQIPDLTPYFTEHSMPSWRVLISFAGVACAKGGVKMSPMDGRDELRGRFTRWIVITAEHAQKNYLRAEKKQLQTVPLEEADVAIVDTALLSAGVTPDSFDFEEQRLAEAFRELPLMRRRILEMLFVEELTPSEIAAKLHCSVQHIYNQRSLAIKRLRERLIKERKNDR